ncbi:hypothetical protein AM493_16235 [Flavobacterium akiainvivens]|uniref:Uncharacterized protein n=1 Tax=Flavobacterium akiainvivens TaxID=1202724 RepID=A0A0M8MK17_9FLAO|nr:hypothetical protein [Flavobacterium akiainvivens]KOS07417.1 hypothetical protein AM493_16235 [Flavobacterium akiainvivens]SFQ47896.1 hypothetical protein SAMN05444144_105228 [Flavobacterium akiainvivens]
MKTLLYTAALFFALATHAQQGPAYTGDYVDYRIETPTEKISIPFPKGAEILENGKVRVDGKTFRIETTEKAYYVELAKKHLNDTLSTEAKDLMTLTYFWSYNSFGKPAAGQDFYTQPNHSLKWMRAPDGTYTIFWNDEPKEYQEQISNSIKTSKVSGSTIVTLALDDAVEHNSDEFKDTEVFMRNTLNSMHKTPVK